MAGELSAVRPLEVWRTADGRVLLHQPGRGREQDWIEVLPAALPWLIERLKEALGADERA